MKTLRPLLIVAATFLFFAGGFGVYWSLQPPVVVRQAVKPPVIKIGPTPGTPGNVLGPGDRPWVNSYKKGQLVSQFTAAEFTPRKDGSIAVDRPVSVFYRDDGGYVLVTGDDGVVYPDSTGTAPVSTGALPATMQSPRNGKLRHVHIAMYSKLSSDSPTLTMDTDNVRYDNDTLQLFTDKYTDPAGHVVEADRVPVAVRGTDYDFDGFGLIVQWNGLTHKMQLLKVAHGKQLVVKNPSRVALPGGSPSLAPSTAFRVVPDVLASADPRDVSLIIAVEAMPSVYRAAFNDDVTVSVPDRRLAKADTMTIDFLDNGGKPAEAGPSQRTPSKPVLPDPNSAPAAAQRIASGPPVDKKTAPLAAPPTTKPAAQPVTVKWTGELRVTLIDTPPIMPLSAGQSAMRFLGSPVVLTPAGSTVTAAVATYRSGDGAVDLQPSAAVPVVRLVQEKGLSLVTHSIDYDPESAVATIHGHSRMEVPQDRKKPMVVTWDTRGLLHTHGTGAQPDGVDRIDLLGNVAVDHPSLTLNSRNLRLDLEPSAPDPKTNKTTDDVKEITATGAVVCRFIQPDKPAAGIDTDKLVIGLDKDSAGKASPRTVLADGKVNSFDDKQKLSADHLEVALRDKPPVSGAVVKPSGDDLSSGVEMESMYARSSVHATMKDGSTADAEEMKVTTVDGRRLVELWADRGAIVNNGKGKILTGSVIHLSPDAGTATVDGPGTIHSAADVAAAPKPGAATRPVDVSWTDSMTVDTAANAVEVVGGVLVRTTDSAGGTNLFAGDTAHIDLEPAAKAGKAVKTDPSAMGDKQVKRVTLHGHVTGDTLLATADGVIVRRGKITGDTLVYTAADGRAEVPGPGRLLMENHKTDGEKDTAGGNRGTMAVQWKDRLTYDDAARKIDIHGDVHAVFRPDADGAKGAKPSDPMRLDAVDLLISLRKTPATAGKNADGPKVTVSRVLATGAVHFTARDTDMYCHTADYDPDAQRLTARGTPAEPGHATDAGGKAVGSFDGTFDELTFDTARQEVVNVRGMGGNFRK